MSNSDYKSSAFLVANFWTRRSRPTRR